MRGSATTSHTLPAALACSQEAYSLELWEELLLDFIQAQSRTPSERWVIMGNSIGGEPSHPSPHCLLSQAKRLMHVLAHYRQAQQLMQRARTESICTATAHAPPAPLTLAHTPLSLPLPLALRRPLPLPLPPHCRRRCRGHCCARAAPQAC
jgi:hypothetical protein